jgi:poly-gamma-glutamate synthesis protein (capsule biosynthesis protein)
MATTSVNGLILGLVNFNQFIGENYPQKTIEAIWQAKKDSSFVVVYAHWGDEYSPITEYQKSLAHSFIDAGADLIVGSHPHIIQETENYMGKNIYYSLGNFIFDQYFSDEVKTGGGVELVFDGSEFFDKKVLFDLRRDGTVCLKDQNSNN